MRNSFDKEIHAICEEDLIYPDEATEIITAKEAMEQKFEKIRRRKEIKDLTRGKRKIRGR